MLEGKNLRLRLLQRRDVELVRSWRNSAEVFQFFSAKEQISELEQEKWFEKTSLDKSSYYFIIETEKGAIGTCNLKNIRWVHRTANWGIYFFPPTEDHGFLPVEATIVLFDYAFNCLNLRKICGEILAGNQRPLDDENSPSRQDYQHHRQPQLDADVKYPHNEHDDGHHRQVIHQQQQHLAPVLHPRLEASPHIHPYAI